MPPAHSSRAFLVVAVLGIAGLTLSGCVGGGASRRRAEEQAIAVERAQSGAENFADEYISRVTQACNYVYAQVQTPRERAYISRVLLSASSSAFTIPSGPNSIVNGVDLVVVATLQSHVRQRTIPRDLGEIGAPIVEAFIWGEQESWRRIERHISREYVAQLRGLIDDWLEENPDTEYVGLIRFDDFSEFRAPVRAGSRSSSSNIFSILMLDPLAGLDPAAREIRETRLFAERLFYHLQRAPYLLTLQFRAQYDTLMASPSVAQLHSFTSTMRDSTERLVTFSESLPDLVAQEREAALDQTATLVERERDAAITQLGDEMQTQSQALLDSFMNEEPRVRGVLEDLRVTVESATMLSESMQQTIAAVETLTPEPTPSPGQRGDPVDLQQVQATIESAQAAVVELNQLASSLDSMLNSSGSTERVEGLRSVLAEAELSGARMIDRAFTRLLITMGVLIGGVLGIALIMRRSLRSTS